MPSSTSNSNDNTNPRNSANNSSNPSRSRSPFADPILLQGGAMQSQSQSQSPSQTPDGDLSLNANRNRFSLLYQRDLMIDNGGSRPATPACVYIVTSNFMSQTTADGVRLSESDIVGFQILAVFARIEDANSYAEHECEEIDAGVRRRRIRRSYGGAVGVDEGEGIRAEAIVQENGTISWSVEDVGQIEVGQWTVQ